MKERRTELVAYCGLYCGGCSKYLNGKCPGCYENEKADWCKIRSCCMAEDYLSCADCKEFNNPSECKKFNNFISKIFAFVFRSDRKACIELIKEKGYEEYINYMREEGKMTIKK
jgi:hypothetical protein